MCLIEKLVLLVSSLVLTVADAMDARFRNTFLVRAKWELLHVIGSKINCRPWPILIKLSFRPAPEHRRFIPIRHLIEWALLRLIVSWPRWLLYIILKSLILLIDHIRLRPLCNFYLILSRAWSFPHFSLFDNSQFFSSNSLKARRSFLIGRIFFIFFGVGSRPSTPGELLLFFTFSLEPRSFGKGDIFGFGLERRRLFEADVVAWARIDLSVIFFFLVLNLLGHLKCSSYFGAWSMGKGWRLGWPGSPGKHSICFSFLNAFFALRDIVGPWTNLDHGTNIFRLSALGPSDCSFRRWLYLVNIRLIWTWTNLQSNLLLMIHDQLSLWFLISWRNCYGSCFELDLLIIVIMRYNARVRRDWWSSHVANQEFWAT